jgi:hypothetical protein
MSACQRHAATCGARQHGPALSGLIEPHAVQGFKHTTSDNFNVLWSGASVKASRLASLHPHQRVNHFPKSHEITRKDRLCANLSRMRAKVRDAARSGKRIEWSIVGLTQFCSFYAAQHRICSNR